MFSSYIENPQNCFFEGQDNDEKILLLVRAHLVTNLSWIIPALLLFLLPFILPLFLQLLPLTLPVIPPSIINALLIINYLLVLIITFEGFLSWYFNVNLITNKRIVDVDFYSILFKVVDQAPVTAVQEASGQVSGVLGLIFNFGDVFVQTAGAKVSIDFRQVPQPTKVADKILDIAQAAGR